MTINPQYTVPKIRNHFLDSAAAAKAKAAATAAATARVAATAAAKARVAVAKAKARVAVAKAKAATAKAAAAEAAAVEAAETKAVLSTSMAVPVGAARGAVAARAAVVEMVAELANPAVHRSHYCSLGRTSSFADAKFSGASVVRADEEVAAAGAVRAARARAAEVRKRTRVTGAPVEKAAPVGRAGRAEPEQAGRLLGSTPTPNFRPTPPARPLWVVRRALVVPDLRTTRAVPTVSRRRFRSELCSRARFVELLELLFEI